MLNRFKDALEAYQIFEKSKIKNGLWVVELRRAELLSARSPEEGAKAFAQLALSFTRKEAQDLAFLRQASLLTDRAERKRLIKALSIEPMSLFLKSWW